MQLTIEGRKVTAVNRAYDQNRRVFQTTEKFLLELPIASRSDASH